MKPGRCLRARRYMDQAESRASAVRSFAIVVVAALIAGCASRPESTPAAPGVNLSGYSPAFRAGYADGCNSVNAARQRDESRFKVDADYAQGWRDGNDICKRRR